MQRRTFDAMGTSVLFLLDTDDEREARAAFDDAAAELARLAALLTRFDPASDLRQLEVARDRRCTSELVEVLELALDARDRSRGRFDPTVLPALRALGYDRTFDEVRRAPMPARPARHAGGGAVHVDRGSRHVRLGPAVALDLGGIAKGWIVDRIAERLARTDPALVDAGGDLACTPRASGAPWSIDVEGRELRIELGAGAVATSGTDRRRWRDPASGRALHHVVDPATGTSAATDLVSVTTVAATCAEAEVAATSLLVAGSADAPRVARAFDVAWSGTTSRGTTIGSEALAC